MKSRHDPGYARRALRRVRMKNRMIAVFGPQLRRERQMEASVEAFLAAEARGMVADRIVIDEMRHVSKRVEFSVEYPYVNSTPTTTTP